MDTQQATIVDSEQVVWEWPGQPAFVPVGKPQCVCMGMIDWSDIARGFHRCGRLLTVQCGPTNFGAGDV